MWGEMGLCGALECEMEVAPQSARCGVVGCGMFAFLPSPAKKKIGAPSNYPGARLFISPPHQTKSNPDMRNSKLAHTRAGF